MLLREGHMRSRLKLSTIIAVSIAVFTPLRAVTIISTINGLAGFDSLGTTNIAPITVRAAEASWSQSTTFSNVSILAEIDPDHNTLPITTHTVNGTAFLMNQIGT